MTVEKKRTHEKKKTQNSKIGDHSIIRVTYNRVCNVTARLASFAAAGPSHGHFEIGKRQEELAVTDLIEFAIFARRLIENAHATSISKGVLVQGAASSGKRGREPITIWDLLNVIIHHDFLDMISNELQRKMRDEYRDKSRDERLELILAGEDHKKRFPPFVVVTSDHGTAAGFRLIDLIEAFQEKVLEPIEELCSDEGLFLESFD